jgi:hypothetical protein
MTTQRQHSFVSQEAESPGGEATDKAEWLRDIPNFCQNFELLLIVGPYLINHSHRLAATTKVTTDILSKYTSTKGVVWVYEIDILIIILYAF